MSSTPRDSKAGPKITVSRRRFNLALGASAAVLAAPAYLRNAVAAGPLKVGCLAPLSGFFAREGQGCKRGFDLAAPILADMGMPIDIIMADTESNPDKARTAAEKAISEGAQVLIGTFVSGETRQWRRSRSRRASRM